MLTAEACFHTPQSPIPERQRSITSDTFYTPPFDLARRNSYVCLWFSDDKISINAFLTKEHITLGPRDCAEIPGLSFDVLVVNVTVVWVSVVGVSWGDWWWCIVTISTTLARSLPVLGQVLTELYEIVFGHQPDLTWGVTSFVPVGIRGGSIQYFQSLVLVEAEFRIVLGLKSKEKVSAPWDLIIPFCPGL